MNEILFKDESYKIIGICMEVHKLLGKGFLEIVYKDALEYEFTANNIPYEREKEFSIQYKSKILAHKYYADFVLYNNIILEIKAVNGIIDEFVKQTLNYLAVSKCKLGLIV
ncbi:MAG: GxxExxY protein, partial [Ignavibacteriaceae bacterium]|nr:GxxExxY protein [Ignavibacteriaceae bacterium]